MFSKSGDSFFRFSHVAALQSFSWKPLLKELSEKAPNLYAFLKAALSSQKKKSLIGMTASVLLKGKNMQMAQIPTIISVILYAGHASKQVCIYTQIYVILKYYRCSVD